MLKEEEIIELLTKHSLSGDERKILIEEYRTNHDLKEIVNILNILEDLAEDKHISIDTLSDYILFLNGDKPENSELSLLQPKIEDHLKNCSKCREEFEFLKSELNEADNFLNKNIEQKEKSETINKKEANIFSLFGNFNVKYGYAVAASIVLILFSLFVVSELSTPAYVKIASNYNYKDFSTTRGRTSVHFMKAITALENKNYGLAVTELQKDIKNNQSDLTTFYSYYVLGITNLTKAHSDFIGLFDSYNKRYLSASINDFSKVLELNNSGLFQNINSNSFFFLGKAYLLKGEFVTAKMYLTKALKNRTEYSTEAKELLSSIK